MCSEHFTASTVPGFPTGLIALFRSGIADIFEGHAQWRLWYLIGSSEMRRRYARSKLGQLWIMLTSAIAISTIGFVWSYLWAQPVREILPYVAIGLVVWQLISGLLVEATTLLPANSRYFHNQYMPASTIVFALAFRHSRDLFHEFDLSASSFGRPGPSAVKFCFSCNTGCVADFGLVFVDVPNALDFVHEISRHHPGRKQRGSGSDFPHARSLDA